MAAVFSFFCLFSSGIAFGQEGGEHKEGKKEEKKGFNAQFAKTDT